MSTDTTTPTLAGAHSHGAGPNGRAHVERFTSRDPDAFGVPTGREEDWRFTPLERMRGLLEPITPDGPVTVEVSAPPQVLTRYVDADDPIVGSVLTPADRVSALALAGLAASGT